MDQPTHFIVGFFAMSLAACTPALTPAGQQVRVRTFRPPGCTEVATVRGAGDDIDHAAPEDATASSHGAMRNEAAEIGANYIWLVGPDTLGSTVSGHALRCDTLPPTDPPPNLSVAPAPASDPEARLKKLKDLFDKGVITRDEYDRQRAAVLQSF